MQQSVAKKCTNSSTIPDPCNGNINGTAINEADKTFALCVKLFESSTTTFVYNHACKSSFIDYTYGCFSQSDCVALVPRSIANLAARSLPITITPSPIPVPDLAMVAVWNRRRHDEPELTWLRALLRRSLEGI
ncbi:hypothetical protein GWI34_38005 [Actinomadura sp. DSM 109109]|nr:hypothetical protein [Actinomadura lepetitiana]